MTRIYTCLVANLFHPGHVAFLCAAWQMGDPLTVLVFPDAMISKHPSRLRRREQFLLACR